MELMESTKEQELVPPTLEAQWGQGAHLWVTTEAWLTPQPCQEGSKREVLVSSADCTDESRHPCYVPAMAAAPGLCQGQWTDWLGCAVPPCPAPYSTPPARIGVLQAKAAGISLLMT